MPELPEVETLRRDLQRAVVGRTITEARVAPDAPRLVQEMPVDVFTTGLRGRRIDGIARRGKYLLIRLSAEAATDPSPSTPPPPSPPRSAQDDTSGLWWVVHRRMSGNLIHRAAGAPDEPYLRARFRLDDGNELRFIDLRKFGTMWLTDDPQAVVAALGPEPLDDAFTVETLAAVLAKRSAPVKAVLLDQTAIAGLGNLYADEALHYASVHPLRPANGLTPDEVACLRDSIVRALEQGLANLGSSIGYADGEEVSLRDHVNLSGEAGGNQEYLVAYGREGRPCRTCGTPIERLKLSNRSAHFCPRCQPRAILKRKRSRAKAKKATKAKATRTAETS
ncbi:MAG: bifunctional DNA-formamidopyrimidine glycosylase/DNA-(apurinic or apyrimidinic site) lyase [Dehalococcoidia bacterium]